MVVAQEKVDNTTCVYVTQIRQERVIFADANVLAKRLQTPRSRTVPPRVHDLDVFCAARKTNYLVGTELRSWERLDIFAPQSMHFGR